MTTAPRPTRTALVTDIAWTGLDIECQILEPAGISVTLAPSEDEQTLCELAAHADAILTNWAPVTERVVAAASRCRLIARYGIGLDNIAVTAATARDIPVTNVPGYCVEEVSDHALALILALARNVAFFHRRTKRGEYDLRAAPPMHRLRGRTLGLLGLGAIARRVAEKAACLGMRVIGHTRSGDAHGLPIAMVDFDTVLTQADVLSIHLPLTDATRHRIDAAALARMKSTALLINTARGPIVDPAALRSALEAGRLAGAALDVFDPEPPDLDDPLYRRDDVIVTPHAAFLSEESVADLRMTVARQALAALQGRRPDHLVNPEVWTTEEHAINNP